MLKGPPKGLAQGREELPLLPERARSEECEGADNHPSCSQSPHDKAVVARCAQDKGQAPTGDWLRRLRRCLSQVIPCLRIMEQRCLKGMMFVMSRLQTEDDSHPPFHFFDCVLRQTPDLFAERLIGYRDQLSQQQVAVAIKRPVSFAKTES